MRFFVLDKYNTWYDWRLTLTAKTMTDPEPKTNYVQIDGRSGTLDLSEALTGEVLYSDRTVTASFRSSEGTFQERAALMRTITRALHGKKVRIQEPDDPEHYFLGRVKIKSAEQDQVHIAFTMEAVCDPWRYAAEETTRRVEPAGQTVQVVINNTGVKAVTPTITTEAPATLTFTGETTTLQAGAYQVAGIKLAQGVNVVGVTSTGAVTFVYREADL